MPQVPLRRKFVQELDDVDRSYKRARLSKYLHDVTSVDALTSDDDAASNASNISSISRISSVSSLSTGSDADASSLTPSKFMERHFAMLEKEIHKLREEFCTTRVLRQKREVRLSAEHPHPKSSSAFTMALQLYGFPMSTCTRRVALIAKERNIPYELNVADLTKIEQKQPDYLPRLGQLFSQVTYITVRFSLPASTTVARVLCGCYISPSSLSSSSTTAMTCSIRASSVATSQRSAPAQSWSLRSPRLAPSLKKPRASSVWNLIRSQLAFITERLLSRVVGRRRTRSGSRSSSLS